MNQGSRTLVYRLVQNSLLQITRAGTNLPSNFVLVILMCCIMVVQLRYQYCCIQYRSSDTACPWWLSFWPLKLCHKICARLSHTDPVSLGAAKLSGWVTGGRAAQHSSSEWGWTGCLTGAGVVLCWDATASVNFLPPMMTIKIIWQLSFQISLSDGLITSSMVWHPHLNYSSEFSERGTVLLQLLEKALWYGVLYHHTVLLALCNFFVLHCIF